MKITKKKIVLGVIVIFALFVLDTILVFIMDFYHKPYYSVPESFFCQVGPIHNKYGIMTEDNTCNYCADFNSCGEYGCLPKMCP